MDILYLWQWLKLLLELLLLLNDRRPREWLLLGGRQTRTLLLLLLFISQLRRQERHGMLELIAYRLLQLQLLLLLLKGRREWLEHLPIGRLFIDERFRKLVRS